MSSEDDLITLIEIRIMKDGLTKVDVPPMPSVSELTVTSFKLTRSLISPFQFLGDRQNGQLITVIETDILKPKVFFAVEVELEVLQLSASIWCKMDEVSIAKSKLIEHIEQVYAQERQLNVHGARAK